MLKAHRLSTERRQRARVDLGLRSDMVEFPIRPMDAVVALYSDGQIELSEACFRRMTEMLVGVAERHCSGRVINSLEGGYNLRALGRRVVQHLIGLR